MEELYTLEKEVGRGSYGVVFEGRLAKTGQRVAIKRLPCNNPECVELYLQELWVMRATEKNHPNVIALHSCLAQTGPQTLKPLVAGNVPLHLVESILKGVIVTPSTCQQVQPINPRRKTVTLQDRTNMAQRLSDRRRTTSSSSLTPQRPAIRARKRSARIMEGQTGPPRCLALWLVMEYCDGGDLNQYLLSRPPDAQRDHTMILQLCSAVAFLHGLGITHRDLKPDNVLVCETATGPVVKVADFGLSKMNGANEHDGSRACFSSICGSVFYMAPEVWGGLSYTALADIFSLGVMFWAILERITFLEEGSTQEQLGAYVCKSRSAWLIPVGEALWENPDLQLSIPMKPRKTPLRPPLGRATSSLLLQMLCANPEGRPRADRLEAKVRAALTKDSR